MSARPSNAGHQQPNRAKVLAAKLGAKALNNLDVVTSSFGKHLVPTDMQLLLIIPVGHDLRKHDGIYELVASSRPTQLQYPLNRTFGPYSEMNLQKKVTSHLPGMGELLKTSLPYECVIRGPKRSTSSSATSRVEHDTYEIITDTRKPLSRPSPQLRRMPLQTLQGNPIPTGSVASSSPAASAGALRQAGSRSSLR